MKSTVAESAKRYIPFKKSKKWKRRNWVNREVVRVSRRKRKAWLRYRENRNETTKKEYDLCKKEVKTVINRTIRGYEQNLASNCKENNKAFF